MDSIYYARGSTSSEQFKDVGYINADHIRTAAHTASRRRSAFYRSRREIQKRIYDRILTLPACSEFMACIHAWADGAGITPLQAFELLDDNSGCQTVMARSATGVVLLHTEEEFEDISARMTAPQIIGFREHGTTKYSLIYNNLLPGAGVFGWGKDAVVAIDSLFLRTDGIEHLPDAMLANIISWITWKRDADTLDPHSLSDLIHQLGTPIDGYAMNIVRKLDNSVDGYKLTFARDIIDIENLSADTGAYLRQINILDLRYEKEKNPLAQWRLPPRNMYKGYWRYFCERLRTLETDISRYTQYLRYPIAPHRTSHERILSELSGPLNEHYVNEVVGAICSVIIDADNLSVAVGLIHDKELASILYF